MSGLMESHHALYNSIDFKMNRLMGLDGDNSCCNDAVKVCRMYIDNINIYIVLHFVTSAY